MEAINNSPTTLKELGMRFVQDESCFQCESGNCHSRSTGKKSDSDGNEIEWFIHVSMRNTSDNYENLDKPFIVSLSMNSTTHSEEDTEVSFDNEIECVNYLLDNFSDFKCLNS